MGFRVVSKGQGNTREHLQKASTTLAKDSLAVFDADGYLVACTSASTFAECIVLEASTAGAGETPSVLVHMLTGNETLLADCTNAVALNQLGNSCDLTDAVTLDNTAVDGTAKAIKIIGLHDVAGQVVECRAVVRAA